MTERANIKLPVEEFEKHNTRRQELGLSWSEYIDGEAPDAPDVEIGADVKEQLDRIEDAAKEATNAAQSAERKIEKVTQ